MGAAEGQPPDPGFRRVNCGPSAWGGTASQHLWAQVAPVNLNDSPEKGQLRSTGQRPRSGAPGSPQYRCLVVHKIHLCCSRCHGAQSLSERDAQVPRTKQGRSCWRDQWVQGRGISSELRRMSRGFPGIWEGASQSGVSTSKGPWGESVGRSKRNSLAGVGKTTQGPMRGRTSFSRPQPSSALRDGLAATASPEQELWSSLVHDGAPAPRVTSAWLPVGAQLGLLPQDVRSPRSLICVPHPSAVANGCRSSGIQEFTKWAFPAAMATPNSTSGKPSPTPARCPWEAQSSPRVARESWGWRSSHCRA